jgi:diguanylate cyclase (GGDEF)-like protein/PAS domain S-box-containing protein
MRYVFVNSTYEHLTGIERDRLIGRTNKDVGMPKDQPDPWETDLKKVFNSGRERNIEFSFSGLFGKRYFWGRIIPEFDRNGSVETVMMVARDITERKQAEEHIRYVSFHDSVTGLYNRAYFEEEIGRLDSDRLLPVSFIMGDVNNLKLTNDTFGHSEGDRMLQEIAHILQEACRDEDIIARWGGDEFAVILPGTDVETARAICTRVKEIAKTKTATIIRPSIALGTAVKTDSEQNIYRIIMKAEARMYDNKLAESRQNQELVISSLLARSRQRWPGAESHISRALTLARTFGRALRLSDSQMEDIDLMIRLHDIGKVVIPDKVLRKPGRLSPKEWEKVRRYPEAGFRIVKTFAETARISDEMLAQRERWDGTGYPRGLQGEEIPYLARVMSVLDVYDVMTHERPYKQAITSDEAVDILRQDAGKHFDPDLVRKFIGTVAGTP